MCDMEAKSLSRSLYLYVFLLTYISVYYSHLSGSSLDCARALSLSYIYFVPRIFFINQREAISGLRDISLVVYNLYILCVCVGIRLQFRSISNN